MRTIPALRSPTHVPVKSPLEAVSAVGGMGTILNVLREVDIRPVRAAAETAFTLAFTSRDEAFADYFAALMYRGDRAQDTPALRAAVSLPLTEDHALKLVDIAVIITRDDGAHGANEREHALVRALELAKVRTIVCFLSDAGAGAPPIRAQWLPASLIDLPMVNGTLDETAAIKKVVRAVRALKAVDDIALARHLPAFRSAVTSALIDDVAFSNAVYSLGTGVLEVNPITGLPLNMADMVILTKNQAIMAYKIALAMGMTGDFKTIMPQLAAVVGSGFIFRQLARGLIGLVPGLGILPKIGVAFAGTYATGEAVRRWCASGERLNSAALREVYDGALARGKEIARGLLDRRGKTGQNARVEHDRSKKPARRSLLPPPERSS